MSNQFFQYSFNRNNNQSVTNIAELDRIQKVGLIKTLNKIITLCNPNHIVFTNSQAVHWLHDGAGLIFMDLKGLLETDLSIGLINHNGLSKSLSSLTNESDLTISAAYQDQVYRFVAGASELDIPASLIDRDELMHLNFEEAETIGSTITISDTTSLSGKSKATPVILQLYADQLSSVWFPDGSAYHFSPLALCESPSQSDLNFRSYAFLRCVGKKADLKVLRKDGEFWLATESLIGVGINACVYEQLFSVL
jgi:hypothetical protein